MDKVDIYTDGACLGNPGPGGWAFIIKYGSGKIKEISGSEKYTTNNKMELTAAIKAVQYFKKALEINPYHEKARIALDNVTKKSFNDGNRAYKRGDLDGALEAYHKVLEFDEEFYQAHYQIGVIEAKMGNRNGSIDHYQQALEINPNPAITKP